MKIKISLCKIFIQILAAPDSNHIIRIRILQTSSDLFGSTAMLAWRVLSLPAISLNISIFKSSTTAVVADSLPPPPLFEWASFKCRQWTGAFKNGSSSSPRCFPPCSCSPWCCWQTSAPGRFRIRPLSAT